MTEEWRKLQDGGIDFEPYPENNQALDGCQEYKVLIAAHILFWCFELVW